MDDPSENSQGDFSPAHGGSETPKQERLRRPQNSFILFSSVNRKKVEKAVSELAEYRDFPYARTAMAKYGS